MFVTADASGTLGTATPSSLGLATTGDIANLQSQINNLEQRDKQLADGIAISLALAQPIFQPGQVFAVRAGWGDFDGSNAVGLTAAGLVSIRPRDLGRT